MTNILLCNQKGGVGKSLIADELAFSFERSKIPVSFIDMDAQGGTIHKTSNDKGAEITIIDTPGALQPQLKDWISEADIIIIPTKTTSRDIEPLRRMQRAVQTSMKSGTLVLYVLNGWNRWRASSDFLEWFEQVMGDTIIYKLPQSEKFVQASASGQSIVEYAGSKNSPAAKATLELCNKVRDLAGCKKEKYKCLVKK